MIQNIILSTLVKCEMRLCSGRLVLNIKVSALVWLLGLWCEASRADRRLTNLVISSRLQSTLRNSFPNADSSAGDGLMSAFYFIILLSFHLFRILLQELATLV